MEKGNPRKTTGEFDAVRDAVAAAVNKTPTEDFGQTSVDAGELTHNELHLIMAAVSFAEASLAFDEEGSVDNLIRYRKSRQVIGGDRFNAFIDKVIAAHEVAAEIDGTL